MKMRTMNSGELGADAVAAVLADVVALVALGGAVDAKVAPVVVVGEDGLGVVVLTSSTLNRLDVVRDGPLHAGCGRCLCSTRILAGIGGRW